MHVQLVPIDEGTTVPVDKPVILFGRHPDCDVVLTNSRKVSRKHCCLVVVDNNIFLRDLGSMNGVRINGERVKQESPVKVGDEIGVGDVRYHLEMAGAKENGHAAPIAPPPTAAPSPPPKAKPMITPNQADISQNFPIPLPDEENVSFHVDDPAPPLLDDIPEPDLVIHPEDDVIPLGEESGSSAEDSTNYNNDDSDYDIPFVPIDD